MALARLLIYSVLVCASGCALQLNNELPKLKLFTVATEVTDGYLRFQKSLETNELDYVTLGLGDVWKGAIRTDAGWGQKVNLLSKGLEAYKDDANLIVMFTDSYDVIISANAKEIVRRFLQFKTRILFGAEGYCWPDQSLSSKYPVLKSGKRYLNSGGFMGYAPDVYALVTGYVLSDTDGDQLYYTKAYLDFTLREKFGIKLDSTSRIFQNLNGAADDIELRIDPVKGPVAKNMAYNTLPVVIHGNGPAKIPLLWLGNYLAGVYSLDSGCRDCNDRRISLDSVKTEELPSIQLAVFIETAVPFLDEFFRRLSEIDYPKSRISLFLHNNVPYHELVVAEFLSKHEHEYSGARFYGPGAHMAEAGARDMATRLAIDGKKDFLFSVDAVAQLTNKQVLRLLIEQNKPILSPMLVRTGRLFSNFWGALSKDGFYGRSDDYLLIAQRVRKSLWNVPFAAHALLIQKERLPALRKAYSYDATLVPDMSFCKFCRDHGHFMIVSNLEPFGHLISPDSFDISKTNPELYQNVENRLEWESRYIHENFTKQLQGNDKIEEPCTDVFRFPLFTQRYCNELIDVMETFGKWSNGKNEDERLQGGYENVPTRDIHMNQVGMEPQWLRILNDYVRPMQEKVFDGYVQRPAEALMNFMVRYRPDEQPSLRPHHDTSMFTINVAMNRAGLDYEGGGCRFGRYNCSILNSTQGYVLMHPGQLTHIHEGLPTTKGTRYIMVSFVNPPK